MSQSAPFDGKRPAPTMFYEDASPGTVFELGSHEMTAEEIVDFAVQFDPQYFHTDAEAAKESPFGGLIASGWHTAAVWVRLWVGTIHLADSRGSPGMDELRWWHPVRPGDVLSARATIEDARPSAKHADRGTWLFTATMTNQRGIDVFTATGRFLIGRRPRSEL